MAARHGTCGHGIGETRHYELLYSEDALRLEDLQYESKTLYKLQAIKRRLLIEAHQLGLDEEINYLDLEPQHELNFLLQTYSKIKDRVLISPSSILNQSANIIFEAAQGVLIDEWVGFHPYTTWSTVTTKHAKEMCDILKIPEDEIKVLGVIRTTTTRHGNGPFPTYSERLTKELIDPNNPTNKWQGNFRVGHFDLPLFNYACNAIKNEYKLDGIAVNHLDQGIPSVCTNYNISTDKIVYYGHSLSRQELIGKLLNTATPCLQDMDEDEFIQEIEKQAPVVIKGRGPTFLDRIGNVF